MILQTLDVHAIIRTPFFPKDILGYRGSILHIYMSIFVYNYLWAQGTLCVERVLEAEGPSFMCMCMYVSVCGGGGIFIRPWQIMYVFLMPIVHCAYILCSWLYHCIYIVVFCFYTK